jgi:hypothetical protein
MKQSDIKKEYSHLLDNPKEYDLYRALKDQYNNGYKEGQKDKETIDDLKKEVYCSICGKDITNEIKHFSNHLYKESFWNDKTDNYDMYLEGIFDNCICAECAKKEMDLAHKKATLKWRQAEEEAKTNNKELRKELSRFHKLFGRFYIKIWGD